MQTPVGKCLNCGKTIQMWRCEDTPGGGTYHIVCFECRERDSRQGVPLTGLWRWVGGIVVIGLVMGILFIVLVLGGG